MGKAFDVKGFSQIRLDVLFEDPLDRLRPE
jgi:hypothetical protein